MPEAAMKRAIQLARRGAGFVSPNPLVGCVILDARGRLLSEGYHARCGAAHAEAMALKKIKNPSALKGAQIFVTLEPCAHDGRTPSCAKALAKLPIRSVTYGLVDPNPLVSGKGVKILESAGIAVSTLDTLNLELEELAEVFLVNQTKGRPFFACKVAASLDGQVALTSGESQWITNELARERGNWLRGAYDAVLSGAGTILTDNPRLDSRAERFAIKPRKLIVLDPEAEVLRQVASLNIFKIRKPGELIFFVKKETSRSGIPSGVEVVSLSESQSGFQWNEISRQLYQRDIRSVFVEAGGFTVSRLVNSGFLDRLFLFQGAQVVGRGQSWTSGVQTSHLSRALTARSLKCRTLGDNIMISARFWS